MVAVGSPQPDRSARRTCGPRPARRSPRGLPAWESSSPPPRPHRRSPASSPPPLAAIVGDRRADAALLGGECHTCLHLREQRDLPSALPLIDESPLHSRIGIAPAGVARSSVGRLEHIRDFVGKLHPVPDAEIQIDLGKLIRSAGALDGLSRGEIDLPVAVARRTGIVRKEGGTRLRNPNAASRP